jgi:peptidyl-prolyl cis-trans isomerase D
MIRILQQDNRYTKIVFAVIIGFAVITMVITLVPGIFDNVGANAGSDVYATVHDPGPIGRVTSESVPVKQSEVTQLAQRQLQQQRLPPFLLPYMEQRAGQILVQRAILKHEADRLNLQVSDGDLRRELQTGPFAQYIFPNGEYIGDDKYMSFVQTAFGTTRSDFESKVKDDMELTRLQALITGGVTVSDNSVRDAYKTQGTKVKFDYAVISAEDLAKTINPSEADLQDFFKKNAARYATAVPESRKIAYFTFDASNLPGGKPQVTDADLTSYYNAHKDQFQVKEQVRVRHILIAAPAGDAAKDAAAKAKAQDILKQIKAGGNFADLASKNSDDPGSKTQGGELGWLDRGKTVPEFDKTAFDLNPGQTSDLVKTQFGYHIIQTEEKKTAHQRSLDEVKPEITPIVEQTKFGATEQNFAKQLSDEAAKNGIDKTAAAHSLHAGTTDFVEKTGVIPALADSSALLTAAFTAAKGAAPQSTATGDGFAIFQVVDVKPAHAPEFAAFHDKLATDYKEGQAPQLLNQQLAKLDDRAKVLNDLRKAAAEMKIPVKSSDLVGRDGQVPDVGSMAGPGSAAFSLDKGAISAPINEGRVGIVLTVTDKQEPTTDDIAKNFASTKDALLNEQHEEIFKVYLGNLTDTYEKKGAIKYTKKQPAPGSNPFGS